MADLISDKTIEYVGILAKLELTGQEKEQAKKDMGRMLDYIEIMNRLDTKNIEPMTHVFPLRNVFREDVVANSDESEKMLENAPECQNNMFAVPRTFEA
nr:Asp-tRNA(Asn)/Glu-tRNA(Gln) amidotransferase subunit GatC [uncultured Acetatifactor sp.]